jgi:hypothetical protein
MQEKEKIYSYKSMQLSVLFPAPISFLVMGWRNYKAQIQTSDTGAIDKGPIKYRLAPFAPLAVVLVSLFLPALDNVQLDIRLWSGIMIGLVIGLSMMYKEQTSDTDRFELVDNKRVAITLFIGLIAYLVLLGSVVFGFYKVQGEGYTYPEYLRESLIPIFDVDAYNEYVDQTAAIESEAFSVNQSIFEEGVTEEQALQKQAQIEALWKENVAISDQILALPGLPSNTKEHITLFKRYSQLSANEAVGFQNYIRDPSEENNSYLFAVEYQIQKALEDIEPFLE